MRRLLITLCLMSGVAAGPVMAQSDVIDLRVGKLEKEMKAVQRKVFPGGAALEPELGGQPATILPAGTAANTPISDLTARVDALESQLKSMTGQQEQYGFHQKKQDELIKALEGRIKAIESPVSADAGSDVATLTPKPAATKPGVAKPVMIAKPTAAKPVAVSPTPLKTDPARKAAIAAVEVPSTGDAAEDTYAYGFRLYTAKLYPEAQTKFKEFITKYPGHKRISYAQNLLGRAYLDEGKPALASVALFDNYTKNPRGDRAPESLYWLGISLTKLKKLPDACKVYSQFDEDYGAKASGDLKARVAKGKTDAKCAAN